MVTHVTRTVHGRRRVDLASLALVVIGLASGMLAYHLIRTEGMTFLLLCPAASATFVGARHLIKRQVPRGVF